MKRTLLTATLLMAGAFTALAGGYRSAYVRFGPPPPPVVYVRPPLPGPGFYWVNGYYRWTGHGYHWVPGRYERIPRGRHVYVNGYWDRRPHGWIWVGGYWR